LRTTVAAHATVLALAAEHAGQTLVEITPDLLEIGRSLVIAAVAVAALTIVAVTVAVIVAALAAPAGVVK
jgi:hypothetical protein